MYDCEADSHNLDDDESMNFLDPLAAAEDKEDVENSMERGGRGGRGQSVRLLVAFQAHTYDDFADQGKALRAMLLAAPSSRRRAPLKGEPVSRRPGFK